MRRYPRYPPAKVSVLGSSVRSCFVWPPYDRIDVEVRDTTRRGPPPGPVWILRIDDVGKALPSIRHEVTWIRLNLPAVPVVLQFPPGHEVTSAESSEIAALLRVDGVLRAGEAIEQRLRSILTAPADLAGDVLAWLSFRGLEPSPSVATIMHVIFDSEPRDASLSDILEPLGVSARSARARFARFGVGPPREWLAIARALRAALAMQRTPETPLLTVAMQRGYTDYSSLSRQFGRLFSTSPTKARECLGWRWLMHRWYEKRRDAVAAHGRSGDKSAG